ncbi:MAG TPA: prenyltransferase/squalene oxidase repeat-containing protein, partial [Tepidisphaeraceae bacterium]|nr:prenyltransferase/squalene oxidase repeat-containing protein [Tepidisphaeraceae bacterium]
AAVARGLAYLSREQRPDGSWLPLWFGNQHAPDDINPVYGTARVLAAYRDLERADTPECQHGVAYLRGAQNTDGGWGGAAGCPSSVEETALAVEVLIGLAPDAVERGLAWLTDAVESGRFREPSPIGFYFAKLWYFEKLYPLIFTVAALNAARARSASTRMVEAIHRT